jgi:Protein of unknown function (DUF3048) N-terminal domain/Protein of unknown function (DUF3048) C-terminal domain
MGHWFRYVATTCAVGIVLVAASFSAASSAPGPQYVPVSFSLQPLPAMEPPVTLPGPLTGTIVPRSQALQRPLAVIVDNYAPDARPQWGLGRASIVFETLAEGGITRFMALYLEHDASKVGPVRSTRLYFDRWAAAFHAILAHVGGNDDAQALLWDLPRVFNLDQSPWEKLPLMTSRENPYWRISSRYAPYNVYVNTYKARSYAASRHQDWTYLGATLPHKRPAPLSQRGHPGSLSIFFVDPLYSFIPANPDYVVRYDFDPTTDTYLRTQGGKRTIDAATHKPLRPANVIVMFVGVATPDANAGPTLESLFIPTIGSGTAWYFRDGQFLTGTWQQRDQSAPLRFLDAHKQPIALNLGQTWIEVLPQYSTATWSPR